MLNIFQKKNIVSNLTIAACLLASTSIYAQSNVKIINSKNSSTQQDITIKSLPPSTSNVMADSSTIKNDTIEKKSTEEITNKKQTAPKINNKTKKSSKEYENGHYVGAVINGMGKNVTYNEAISQIVPSSWNISIEDDVQDLMQGSTSWKGGRAWTKVLRSCFQNSNIIITIDVANKQVNLQSKLAYTAKKQGYTYQILPSDKNLRNAFARWAQQAGYQFVWDLPRDIPNIGMYYASKGTLEEALNEVIEAINIDSDLHIAAIFHETNSQKVLRITKYIKEAAK